MEEAKNDIIEVSGDSDCDDNGKELSNSKGRKRVKIAREELNDEDLSRSHRILSSGREKEATPVGFCLTRIPGLPAISNEYCLALNDIISGDFHRCLLSNYMIDIEWLGKILPVLKDRNVLLVHGERNMNNDEMARIATQVGFKECSFYKPRLDIPYGTHHTKMAILEYEEGIRIAIFTNNFIERDWSSKSQALWAQDFPKRRGNKTTCSTTFDFQGDLKNYLENVGGPVKEFARSIDMYDFKEAGVILLPSIPGRHKGNERNKYGHMRLRSVLRSLCNSHKAVSDTEGGVACKIPSTVISLQCSSLGSFGKDGKWITDEVMESFKPCRGVDAQIHLIWPTCEDVRNSLEGWAAGRSIPCPTRNMFEGDYSSTRPLIKRYLKPILRKWDAKGSGRSRAMPHLKSYVCYDYSPEKNEVDHVYYVVMTSANLSKAAWGELQKNGSSLFIRSYEMGILCHSQWRALQTSFSCTPRKPLPTMIAACTEKDERIPLKVNYWKSSLERGLICPLPYELPAPPYKEGDVPWVWDQTMLDLDIFGEKYP